MGIIDNFVMLLQWENGSHHFEGMYSSRAKSYFCDCQNIKYDE
jgi:hypothetical protein